MATNTIVLLVVATIGALVLAVMLAVVVVKTRARARDGKDATMANESALQRRRELLADAAAERAHDAMAEIESSLRHQATSYRSEAVTSRDQLNEQRVHRLAG